MSNVIDQYSVVDAQIKALQVTLKDLKQQILDMNESKLIGDLCELTISESYPVTFSKDLAETLLSPEDFKRCHATAIKPTKTIRIKNKILA